MNVSLPIVLEGGFFTLLQQLLQVPQIIKHSLVMSPLIMLLVES
jgi:hypothetical protein